MPRARVIQSEENSEPESENGSDMQVSDEGSASGSDEERAAEEMSVDEEQSDQDNKSDAESFTSEKRDELVQSLMADPVESRAQSADDETPARSPPKLKIMLRVPRKAASATPSEPEEELEDEEDEEGEGEGDEDEEEEEGDEEDVIVEDEDVEDEGGEEEEVDVEDEGADQEEVEDEEKDDSVESEDESEPEAEPESSRSASVVIPSGRGARGKAKAKAASKLPLKLVGKAAATAKGKERAMTTRQAVLASVVDVEHVSLDSSPPPGAPFNPRKKPPLDAAALALRREETARKRRNLSERKLEDEKAETINRLLKRQSRPRNKRTTALASTVATSLQATATATPTPARSGSTPDDGEEPMDVEDAATKKEPEPPKTWRWVSRGPGLVLGVPIAAVPVPFPANGDQGTEERATREMVCGVKGCGGARKYGLVRDWRRGACSMGHLKALEAM